MTQIPDVSMTNNPPRERVRRPYAPPRLVKHGTVASITAALPAGNVVSLSPEE